jgi:hypothetical protein
MFNIKQLATELTATQFEQLLRFRLQNEFDRLPAKVSLIFLSIQKDYGEEGLIKHCEWQVGGYSDIQTKGEILTEVVTEHNRRLDFVQSCKLTQLTHEAVKEEPTS